MKLVVAELDARSKYVSREFAYLINDLTSKYGWTHVETEGLLGGPGSLKDVILRRFGELPEILLLWEGYYVLDARAKEFQDLDCQKWILCDDLHWWSDEMKRSKQLAFSMCDAILSTYGYVFDQYYPELSKQKKVFWLPHSASPDFLLPFNEHPENAIFLSGALSRQYPMRLRMKELFDRRSYPIVFHQHPGYRCNYDYENDAAVGRAYAKRINSYRIGFTDCLQYRYTVAKYFEIPATGSLLLADDAVSEPLSTMGFIENQHYIATSSRDLEEKIAYVLDEKNHDRLDQIRKSGQELIWQKHKTSDRASMLDRICTLGDDSLKFFG